MSMTAIPFTDLPEKRRKKNYRTSIGWRNFCCFYHRPNQKHKWIMWLCYKLRQNNLSCVSGKFTTNSIIWKNEWPIFSKVNFFKGKKCHLWWESGFHPVKNVKYEKMPTVWNAVIKCQRTISTLIKLLTFWIANRCSALLAGWNSQQFWQRQLLWKDNTARGEITRNQL